MTLFRKNQWYMRMIAEGNRHLRHIHFHPFLNCAYVFAAKAKYETNVSRGLD